MQSEAQKKASRKWDSENMKNFSVKVRIELYESVKAKATQNGDSVNAICKRALEEYIRQQAD